VADRARAFNRILVSITFAAASPFFLSCASPSSNNQPLNLNRHDTAIASPAPSSSATQKPVASPAASIQASETPPPENTEPAADTTLVGSYIGRLKLIIPVQGVRPDQLQDTFMDARSEGRVHDAIDIPAPAGTPVMAAADGEIARLFQSERGGITIYQYGNDKRLIFYYAHLQRYADGLMPGKVARQGEIIAYVGDTGNAGAGNYHLHFSISVIPNPARYWEGTNINPYPLLRNSG
jgi:murein DD-endopeptidase MepM/ murein hydrolase activator NlpD